MLVPLGLLPALCVALLAYALRPAGPVVAPLRLALVRAAVPVAAVAVVTIEGLSTVRGLTAATVVPVWVVLLGLASLAAWRRYRRDGALPGELTGRRSDRPRGERPYLAWWRDATTGQRVLIVALAGLVLAELVLAAASPPNNWDSQTYHLPKIEHWVQSHDVDFYATQIDRQVGLEPGAEYLLLHLRLLTGGELLYNLLQWSAGLGCALVASRITAQLGGARTAQLVTALVVGTTPMVVLESTSTQTDLAVAAWVACVATLVLDELHRRTPVGAVERRLAAAPTGYAAVALIGAGTGLVGLTKATGALGVAPVLLVWFIAQLRRAPLGGWVRAALVAGLALAIVGPYLYRTTQTYHTPLGAPHEQELVAMQRHDPASLLVNAMRLGYTALETPVQPLDRAVVDRIRAVARGLGVDPSDPEITFFNATFPTIAWPPDEDRASLPVQGTLVLVGAVVLLVRRRVPGLVRGYAAVFWVAVLLHVGTVKWQPWGNRLLLYLLVLGAPLVGVWLGPVLAAPPAARRRVAAWAVAVTLVVGACAGWLSVGYGWPRRLVGPGSTFSESRLAQRFNRRPQWAADYAWGAGVVRASGARRVGLVEDGDTWEYPWWVLLRGTRIEELRSAVPGYRPPVPVGRVDAVLCVSAATTCAAFTPPGWRRQVHGIVQVVTPPSGPGHSTR